MSQLTVAESGTDTPTASRSSMGPRRTSWRVVPDCLRSAATWTVNGRADRRGARASSVADSVVTGSVDSVEVLVEEAVRIVDAGHAAVKAHRGQGGVAALADLHLRQRADL